MAQMEPLGGYHGQFDVFDLVRMDELLESFELGDIARFDVSDLARA